MSEVLRLIFEGVVALGVFGGLAMTLVKLGAIGNTIETHGKTIDRLEKTAERQAETLQLVAVQKSELGALREIVIAHTKRTDESFNRTFSEIDRLKERRS